MARPGVPLSDNVLFSFRSFLGGCFSCLGVFSAGIVIFVMAFVFQPQVVAVLRSVTVLISTSTAGLHVPATAFPSGAGELTALEIFITQENQPNAPHVTQLRLPLQQPIFVCVRNPVGVVARFSVRVILPNGQTLQFGSDFATDPSGRPFCLGAVHDLPNTPGVFRFDAVIGSTVVGSTVLTVVP